MSRARSMERRWALAALPMLALLALPLVALILASSPSELVAGARDPLFLPALWLSLRTTAVSLVAMVLLGTPLAWWLARTRSRWAGTVDVIVDLPIVLPPAVVGIALLESFGRSGLLGPLFEGFGVRITFTTTAVVLAQVVVAAACT